MDLSMLLQKAAISFICIFSSFYAFAQESKGLEVPDSIDLNLSELTPQGTGRFSLLLRGDSAPMEGILLDPDAFATVFTELREEKEKLLAEMDRKVGKIKAEKNMKIDNLKLELDITKRAYQSQLDAERERIKKLEEAATSVDIGKIALYTGLGAAGGIAVTALLVLLSGGN